MNKIFEEIGEKDANYKIKQRKNDSLIVLVLSKVISISMNRRSQTTNPY